MRSAASISILLCCGAAITAVSALDASPALPLVPMFPSFPHHDMPPQPQPFSFFPALLGGLEKVIEGASGQIATSSGAWEQNDSEKLITITGNLPVGFDVDGATVEANGKELSVTIKKTSTQRKQSEDGKPEVKTENDVIERTFVLPFEVKTADVRKEASENTIKLEMDVPEGVKVTPGVHAPELALSSFSYRSGDSNAQSMVMGAHNFLGESGHIPLRSFMAPFFALHPQLGHSSLFVLPPSHQPQLMLPGFAHDASSRHALRKLGFAPNTNAKIETNTADGADDTAASDTPNSSSQAKASNKLEPDNPFLPALTPRRGLNQMGGFGGDFATGSLFGGNNGAGFGGLFAPLFLNPSQLFQGLNFPQPQNTLGEWTQTITPQQVVVVGNLPSDGDPSRVFITVTGRKLLIKGMSRSTNTKKTKDEHGTPQGTEEQEEGQSEKQIFTLPFETDMSKVQKVVDPVAKKITLTIPVPPGVTVEAATNVPMQSMESFSSHSFSSGSGSASGHTFSRSFYGTSMF